jgi:integrase
MLTCTDAAMVVLLAYAGLRPEELVALRWGDLQGGVIVVDRAFTCGELKGTKSGARRTVEIIPPLAHDLAAYRPHVTDPDALIAPNASGGFLHWGNWRNRVWSPACAAAGVKAAPYDLRHTYCSLRIHEGRSPLLVAAAMGHASGELVWRRYGHLFDAARLAPAVSMVDAIEAARAELRRSGVRRMFAGDGVRVLRSPTLVAGR